MSGPPCDLRVGIAPLADFTLLAFAGFIDTLRLAADDGDRSRPLRCRWEVVGEGASIRASCGVAVQPTAGYGDPARFDYVAVVGGTLHGGARETPRLLDWLRAADAARVPLIGLCTGSFTLARAGLMMGRRACLSWFHHDDYRAEFPDLAATSDRLLLDDGDRITSAGGVSAVRVASRLVERHLGADASAKGLRIMMEEVGEGDAQPPPRVFAPAFAPATDPRVRRALLLMERRLGEPLAMAAVAVAAGTTPRSLTRLFRRELGCAPAAALMRLRLERARVLAADTPMTLAAIAADCGFADAAHLARRARQAFGSPLRQL